MPGGTCRHANAGACMQPAGSREAAEGQQRGSTAAAAAGQRHVHLPCRLRCSRHAAAATGGGAATAGCLPTRCALVRWHTAPPPQLTPQRPPLHHPSRRAGPLAKIYFGSQFAPLIIFFVMFLSVVKNTKLHHFVRFNCMQARSCRAARAAGCWAAARAAAWLGWLRAPGGCCCSGLPCALPAMAPFPAVAAWPPPHLPGHLLANCGDALLPCSQPASHTCLPSPHTHHPPGRPSCWTLW